MICNVMNERETRRSSHDIKTTMDIENSKKKHASHIAYKEVP